MTVEAEITRSLGIRFIDARQLASEAKITEGISGYATKEQVPILIVRAKALFEAKSEEEKELMRQANDDLESIKSSHHSRGSDSAADFDDNGSLNSSNSATMRSRGSGLFRKVVSLGQVRNRNQLPGSGGSNNSLRNAAFNLKRNSSMGGMPTGSRPTPSSLVSEKRKQMSRVDRLGHIMDIHVPCPKSKMPLDCIQSGRAWDES